MQLNRRSELEEKVLDSARKKLKRVCKVCKVCDGKECISKVPGMGGVGSNLGFIRNVEDFSRIFIIPRYIHENFIPDTSFCLQGYKFKIPVIQSPFTGARTNLGGAIDEEVLVKSFLLACKELGCIATIADGATFSRFQKMVELAIKYNTRIGIILKPRKDDRILYRRLEIANSIKPLFIGIDLDGATLPTMSAKAQETRFFSLEDIKDIKSMLNVPFIPKGVMSSEDMIGLKKIGIDFVWISNHGGRVLESLPSTIRILYKQKKLLDKLGMRAIVDGGIRSGEDIFKALSLGALAVGVGRPFIIYGVGGLERGIRLLVEKLENDLKKTMLLCGIKDIESLRVNGSNFIEIDF